MNKRHARQIALMWLYYACDDPEVYFSLDDDLPLDEHADVARDKVLDAFYDLQQEFARRTGQRRARDRGDGGGSQTVDR